MKAVIQRVTSASVEVDGKIIGSIKNGFLILLGVVEGDIETEAKLLTLIDEIHSEILSPKKEVNDLLPQQDSGP